MTLNLCVLTPNRIVWDSEVKEIILSTNSGQIGVLANHAPIATAVDIGILKIRLANQWLTMALMGGFARIGNNEITILVNDAEKNSDIDRSNEATMKYLLMGGASSSILVHGFSWLYGSSGGEIELQEIVNGLINTQMYNSPGISIALIFITVGIGFKLSLAPSHQWTPDVYEGVRFV